MSWQQINDIQARGVDIGSYTLSHAALTDISPTQREREVLQSKSIQDAHLKKPIEFIAYPHGKFDVALFELLTSSGYQGAFSGVAGLNFTDANTYQLKRISILRPKYDIWSFQARLTKAVVYSKLGI
ncbi:polysaccharide deacetylase family protein [Sporomusa acidovorans]|uniref:polysaccharide deacetylase family protein n=1 Tax=Sporomusa acidovorans TaxID=112900 RepID=UPI003CCBE502